MNHLSLFSGAGGGDLAAQYLLGWRTIGYVEKDMYCQTVIAARIADGTFHEAPIFGDIRAFIAGGYARRYRGVADVVTAGFPCQPFSVAGKRRGSSDDRDMWPATRRALGIVAPEWIMLENVPGLLTWNGGLYIRRILGQLATMGYDLAWGIISAADVGAPHLRRRMWIVAHSNGERYRHPIQSQSEPGSKEKANRNSGEVPDTAICGCERSPELVCRSRREADESGWWFAEPRLGRVADGVANRANRLRAIGNGQVPAVAATAWGILSGALR